ncbi:MAG: hypothetical protein ABJA50_08120 [Chloroflexota bacterium]
MRHLLNQAASASPVTGRLHLGRLRSDVGLPAERDALRRMFVRAYMRMVLLLIVATFAAACDVQRPASPTTGAATMTPSKPSAPADFALIYEYRAGSMPPPYHDEYTVTMGPGPNGNVVYRPDYPSSTTPTWTVPLTVTVAQLDSLYSFLKTHKLLRTNWRTTSVPSVGGSVRWATYTAGGVAYEIPADLDLTETDPSALYDYVSQELVPQSVWTSLNEQRTRYQDNYSKNYNSP